MRLGVLGPACDDMIGLARAAQYLLDEAHADKVIYLADDGALERVVFGWAREIVGSIPTEDALFKRAAARCAKGSHDDIDRFVESERARLRLKVFVSLPGGSSRSMEILDGRVALFAHERRALDADDIAAASLLVFGKADEPLIHRVGPRLWVSPGTIGTANGGSALLDDGAGGVRIEIINASGAVTERDYLSAAPIAKLRVTGGS